MNEATWLVCTDPTTMLESLRGGASTRKLRLFAAACCRRAGDPLEATCRRALDVLDLHVDGRATTGELYQAYRCVEGEWVGGWYQCPLTAAVYYALDVWDVDADSAAMAASVGVAAVVRWGAIARAGRPLRGSLPILDQSGRFAYVSDEAGDAAYATERVAQSRLLRDIFHGPRRPVYVRGTWRSADALALARGIYEERAFDRLPILADALMDAGCDCEDILDHCRSPGEHVRGCWALDAILLKS
jgi:hypothetical protein